MQASSNPGAEAEAVEGPAVEDRPSAAAAEEGRPAGAEAGELVSRWGGVQPRMGRGGPTSGAWLGRSRGRPLLLLPHPQLHHRHHHHE